MQKILITLVALLIVAAVADQFTAPTKDYRYSGYPADVEAIRIQNFRELINSQFDLAQTLSDDRFDRQHSELVSVVKLLNDLQARLLSELEQSRTELVNKNNANAAAQKSLQTSQAAFSQADTALRAATTAANAAAAAAAEAQKAYNSLNNEIQKELKLIEQLKRIIGAQSGSQQQQQQQQQETQKQQQLQVQVVPFYRYYNGKEHFYTTSISEIGATTVGQRGNYGYVYEGVQCKIYPSQVTGTAPFYRYFNGVDHFYTLSASEIGTTTVGQKGNYGYQYEGVAGYIYSTQAQGTIPLYRYFNGVEHFYTTSDAEIGTTTAGQSGNHGYKAEGIAGYVLHA